MDFPALPTDNLYKFIALAGLVVTLVSLTYPTGKIVELELGLIEAQSQRTKLEIEVSEIDRLAVNLQEEKSPTVQDVSGLRERLVQSKIKRVDLVKSVSVAEIQLQWVYRYSVAAIVGVLLGCYATFLGFRSWYANVQRPNDLLLVKQLDNSV